MVNRRWLLLSLLVSSVVLRCSSERNFREGEGGGKGGLAGAKSSATGGAAGQGGVGDAGATQAGATNADAGAGGALDGASGSAGQPNDSNEAGQAGANAASGAGGIGDGGASNASGGRIGSGGASNGGAASGAAGKGGAASGGAASGGANSGGSAGAPCSAPSSQCVKAAPTGWQGPLVVTSNSASCPAAFPSPLANLYTGLVPGNASCTCACGAPNTQCSATGNVTFYNQDGCTNGVAGTVLSTGMCVAQSSSVGMSLTGSVTASCGAGSVQSNIAASQWSNSLSACGGAVKQGNCTASDEVCVAAPATPFAAKYCIQREGDQTCPTGYPARSVMYSKYEDARHCPQTCDCSISGQGCELQVEVNSRGDCTGTTTRRTIALNAGYSCVISNTTAHKGYFAQIVTRPGTCSSNATLSTTGSVSPAGATTVCCTQ
ncbi:MAG: hypothetical protein ACOY0T_05935 [Myxococcota bacterium]